MNNILEEDILIQITNYLYKNNKKITCAESCTGGLLSYYLTKLPSSSKYFEYGFITYSNQAKHNILKVPKHILNKYGAVSKQTILSMATGALIKANANISISISGIAGPSTDEFNTPLGTVFFAITDNILNKNNYTNLIFKGNREQVKNQAVKFALQFILDYIKIYLHG